MSWWVVGGGLVGVGGVMLSSVRPGKSCSRDRCPILFLQDCVAVNPQDAVDTANSQTFSKEGELCPWVLAELDAFVQCSDDICLAQQLVRDELP